MNALPKICSWLAIASIVATGLIHAIEAPGSFGEAAYKGWLFALNGVGALVAACGISHGKSRVGWNLGLLIAAGSLVGYVASRTVGLPGIPAEPEARLEPLGVASLVAEVLFVACWTVSLRG